MYLRPSVWNCPRLGWINIQAQPASQGLLLHRAGNRPAPETLGSAFLLLAPVTFCQVSHTQTNLGRLQWLSQTPAFLFM